MQQTQVFRIKKFKIVPDFQKLTWQWKQPQAHINMATEINTIKHKQGPQILVLTQAQAHMPMKLKTHLVVHTSTNRKSNTMTILFS